MGTVERMLVVTGPSCCDAMAEEWMKDEEEEERRSERFAMEGTLLEWARRDERAII